MMTSTVKECREKYRVSPVLLELSHCAERYRRTINLDSLSPQSLKKINQNRGRIIADYFAELPHNPHDLKTKRSYEQLAKEVYLQYQFAEYFMGIKFEPWFDSSEPYNNSCQMFADVCENRHLYFLTTASGFGTKEYKDNPMLQSSGKKVHGYEILINDMFRAIHDLFGHAMKVYGFGAVGEEKAWYEHSQMFSPLARPALTTETRGQSCWVNYGSHLRDVRGNIPQPQQPEYIPLSQRPFAEQKTGLLPAEISGVSLSTKGDEVIAVPLPDWNPNLELN